MSKLTRVIDLARRSDWAIKPENLDAIHNVLARRDAGMEAEWLDLPSEDEPVRVLAGGVAVIPVQGVIAKRMNLFSRISGGTSTELIERDFRLALDNPDVRSILLDVDSPGGTVDGTEALASAIYAARGRKPVVAFANGLMASAAYWIGSAADILLTGPTGEVGSIGVIQAHYDYSEADRKQGVRRTYIYAGKYKTAGNDAEPLSDDSLAYLQDGVDYVYRIFVDAVARHRNVSTDEALRMAEGRIYIGQQAADIGLVDRIGTMEQAVQIALDMGATHYIFGRVPGKEEYIMTEVQAAEITVERLEQEAPDLLTRIRNEARESYDTRPAEAAGASAERNRILALAHAHMGAEDAAKFQNLVESGITVEQYEAVRGILPAAAAPTAKMEQMLEALHQAGAANPGADSAPGRPGSFTDAWQAIRAERKCTVSEAMKQAVKDFPELHQAYIRDYN